MNKVKFSFYFIFVSVLTLITILVILVQNSYTNLVTTPKSNVESNTLLSNINPNLDLDVLAQIESRSDNSDNILLIESESVVSVTPTLVPIVASPKNIPTPTQNSSSISIPTPSPSPSPAQNSNDESQFNDELNNLNNEFADLLNPPTTQ